MKTTNTNVSRHIYSDGAAPNNQNGCTHGGLGVVVLNEQGEVIETYKARVEPVEGKITTTNVRCEMNAFIKALEMAEHEDIIHTDNEMIAKGYNEWLEGWKLGGWKNGKKKPIANPDLWQCIDRLKQEKPNVVVKWVRGHSGIYGNELADSLATEAAA